MRENIITVLIVIGVVFGLYTYAKAQIPTSSISDDCSTAYVNATNPMGSVDTSEYSSIQINQAILRATTDEAGLRQRIAQDDVTLGLFYPLKQAIAQCMTNQQSNQSNAT